MRGPAFIFDDRSCRNCVSEIRGGAFDIQNSNMEISAVNSSVIYRKSDCGLGAIFASNKFAEHDEIFGWSWIGFQNVWCSVSLKNWNLWYGKGATKSLDFIICISRVYIAAYKEWKLLLTGRRKRLLSRLISIQTTLLADASRKDGLIKYTTY